MLLSSPCKIEISLVMAVFHIHSFVFPQTLTESLEVAAHQPWLKQEEFCAIQRFPAVFPKRRPATKTSFYPAAAISVCVPAPGAPSPLAN